MINTRELRARRADLVAEAEALVKGAEMEDRNLTDEEQAQFDGKMAEAETLKARIERQEALSGIKEMAEAGRAPVELKIQRGDDERTAMNHWFRTGDIGGLGHMVKETKDGPSITVTLPERRAVTNSTMNITTAGDGGNLNPTGFVPQIAERMSERMLADRLGVRRISGTASVVDFPTQAADPQVFATTAEQTDAHDVTWERDALQFGKTSFTLVWKTKVLELTLQLLQNSAVDLNSHIAKMIGDNVALTHNAALVTEVAANGSALKTFASASAIAAGEIEDIVYSNTLAYYLEDDASAAWVMRPPTFGDIVSLTGNARLYAETPAGSFNRTIMGYPVLFSGQVAAQAASAKPVLFGVWNNLGLYENPNITLLRDPYSVAGMVLLKYHFALDYGVLQAGGIGYGVHPSA